MAIVVVVAIVVIIGFVVGHYGVMVIIDSCGLKERECVYVYFSRHVFPLTRNKGGGEEEDV